MNVSDDAINDFINNVSDKRLDRDALNEVLAAAVNDNRSSPAQLSDQLFEAMRFELLAKNFETLLLSDSIDYGTPEQRWDYFSRLYREATVQVLPVSVSDFVSKVPTPSNDELEAMFNQYKDQLKRPEFPQPGFMVPAQAKFQYFKADRANFVKAAEAKLTDKQINDYYEKHKESYRKSTFDESEVPAATPKTGETSKTGATPRLPAVRSQNPPRHRSPPRSRKPPTTQNHRQPTRRRRRPTKNRSRPTTRKPMANRQRRLRMANRPTPVPPRDTLATTIFWRVADTTPPASTAPAATATSAKSDAAKTESAKPNASKAPTKPDAVKSEPAKIPPPKVEPPKAGPSTPPVTKANPAKPASATDDEFRPVTDPKVREDIRSILANEAVTSQINDAFAKIRTEVQVYSRQHMDWVGNGSSGEAPPPPDYKALAKTNGFTFGDTPMMTADEAPDVNELGKSWIFSAETFSRAPFQAVAFDPNLPAYMPDESSSIDGEITYLWWRTDFTKAYVPNFVDAKPQVTLAWKMVEARKLALGAAKKDADDANKRRATLKEIFQNRPNMNVAEVGPFHWLSIGNVPMGTTTQQRISLTNLSGVDMAGEDFMHAVFKTEVGSATAAFNQPQTVAYVIQLQKLEPSEDMFRRQFLTYQEQSANSQNAGPAWSAARGFAQPVEQAKLQTVFDELGVKKVAGASSTSQPNGQPEEPDDEGD